MLDPLNDKARLRCKIVEYNERNVVLEGKLFDGEAITFSAPRHMVQIDSKERYGLVTVDVTGKTDNRASIVLPGPDLIRGHKVSVGLGDLRR